MMDMISRQFITRNLLQQRKMPVFLHLVNIHVLKDVYFANIDFFSQKKF